MKTRIIAIAHLDCNQPAFPWGSAIRSSSREGFDALMQGPDGAPKSEPNRASRSMSKLGYWMFVETAPKAAARAALLFTLLLSFANASAQGSKADYERAFSLRQVFEGKVLNASVDPEWITNSTRFWYRRQTSTNTGNYVVVDAATGAKTPAFDHVKLAETLAKATGSAVAADRLNLSRLEIGENGSARFRFQNKGWEYDETKGLRSATNLSAPAANRVPRERARASVRTGESTSLTFQNNSTNTVEVFWVDTGGDRKSYGKIPPGGSHVQHTYGGHIWVVMAGDQTLGYFEASDDPATVDISDDPGPMPEVRLRGGRRGGAPGRSPDGRWTATIRDFNLFLVGTNGEAEIQLSTDGTKEFPYTRQIFWSPDSKKLAAMRQETVEERKVYIVESSPADQVQPKLRTLDYAKPGDRLAQSKPVLFDIANRRQIDMATNLFANQWNLSRYRWEPDSKRFTFLFNARGHQTLRVLALDAENGAVSTIIEETSPTFIDYSGKLFYDEVNDGKEIVWMSERDGWCHLWLYDAASGKVKNQITKGDWVVRKVEQVDEEKRQIWFYAGGVDPALDPYYQQLCRVNFDGSGFVVLTPGDGTHSVKFSPDRKFLVDSWSRVDRAPITVLRSADDGKQIVELERADWATLLATGWRTPERFVAKGRDGVTDIYGVILRPTNFDPTKKYPVIEYIYAGPHSAFVPKEFRASFGQMDEVVNLGFILVQIDGMGTSQRSKKFHDVAWKNLADSGFPDRIPWIKAAAAKHSEMDLSRVGIYGGSAGGQSSTRGMLDHGDFYKACVSDCGCHDNRMDKIWWNEQWMGWPVDDSYRRSSNVEDAHKLRGKLMLVVGEVDSNVDPASTMQVVNALIKADKDFDLLVIPGSNHGAAESSYGRRRRADFFVRHLLGSQPRWE
jgi:dipeptidyl aminopeptidase/acylaminoacyl peptidase